MPVDVISSGNRSDQLVVVLAALTHVRFDFNALCTDITERDPAAVQEVFAALEQEQRNLPNQANAPLRTDTPCPGCTSADQFPWPVLVACTLFACQGKEPAKPQSFPGGGASQRGAIKQQYKCTECAHSVVVDQLLRPDEMYCPICGAPLAYRGNAR